MSVIGGLIGIFGVSLLALVLGFASARGDHRIGLKWPHIWPPMLTLHLFLLLLGGILAFIEYTKLDIHTVAGLELMSIGLMFIAVMLPLLMGYSHGARPAPPGWWQKVHLDALPVVGAAPENADRVATLLRDAR